MLGTPRTSPEQLQALQRVQQVTRERFALQPNMAVLVTELACVVPGCPPLETVVAFWTAPHARHQFRVFKPARAVLPDDLPYAWQKPTLRVLEGEGCDCC